MHLMIIGHNNPHFKVPEVDKYPHFRTPKCDELHHISAFLKKEDIIEEVEGYMNKTFNGTAYNDMTNSTKQIVDLIQDNLECCG